MSEERVVEAAIEEFERRAEGYAEETGIPSTYRDCANYLREQLGGGSGAGQGSGKRDGRSGASAPASAASTSSQGGDADVCAPANPGSGGTREGAARRQVTEAASGVSGAASSSPKTCGGSGRVLSGIRDGGPLFRDCEGCPDCSAPEDSEAWPEVELVRRKTVPDVLQVVPSDYVPKDWFETRRYVPAEQDPGPREAAASRPPEGAGLLPSESEAPAVCSTPGGTEEGSRRAGAVPAEQVGDEVSVTRDALRLLAVTHFDHEQLIRNEDFDCTDLYNRGLLRSVEVGQTSEYEPALTAEGFALIAAALSEGER